MRTWLHDEMRGFESRRNNLQFDKIHLILDQNFARLRDRYLAVIFAAGLISDACSVLPSIGYARCLKAPHSFDWTGAIVYGLRRPACVFRTLQILLE